MTPPGPAAAVAARAPHGEVVRIACGHFDVYVEPHFEDVVAAETAFLVRTLART